MYSTNHGKIAAAGFLAALVLSLGLAPLAPGRQPTPKAPPLGLNLAGVSDWSSEIVFVDAFRAARPWVSQAKGKPWGQGGPLDLDPRGHVRSLAEGQYAEAIVFTGFQD